MRPEPGELVGYDTLLRMQGLVRCSILLAVAFATTAQGQDLTSWLDARAQKLLDERDRALAQVKTREDAMKRQEFVRKTILRLIGGLPETNAPLNPVVTGVLKRPGFRVEKVRFDSLPGYPVTANLYVPDKPGRHPGILFSLGHWEAGKSFAYLTAANLALKGFVVLAYDPVGQGERLQVFDPRLGRSLAGGPTDQHFMDGARELLAGRAVGRWFIHDSRRSLDYLASRPEVDADRLGATGCSGGGTQTAFFAALEPRLKAVAPACYITSFRELFAGSVGDSEQSPHGLIEAGLDLPDLIMAAAPKPYLVINTEKDFFPIAGARRAVSQAKAFYRVFDAESQVRHAVGPGGHGTPIEVRRELYRFFLETIGDTKQPAEEVAVAPLGEPEFWVTKTGQLAGEPGVRELWQVISEEHRKMFHRAGGGEIRAILQRWMTEPEPKLPAKTEWMTAAPGVEPKDTAFVVVQPWPWVEPLALELQKQGYPVLLVRPRGTPLDERQTSWNNGWLDVTRASLTGLSLNGLRARDIVSAVEEAAAAQGVKHIRAYGRRSAGVWLLMAAAVEPRIEAVWVHQTPASWREAMTAPLHRALFEIAAPGVALEFDVADLRSLIGPRPVFFTDPGNATRLPMPRAGEFTFRPWDSPDADYLPEFLRMK